MWFSRIKARKNKYSDLKFQKPVNEMKPADDRTSAHLAFELDPIQLVEGKFNAVDAADVLISLLNDKIRYHTIKAMNTSLDKADRDRSLSRIDELKKSKSRILDLVVKASKMGKWVEIDSSIYIKLIDCPSENTEGAEQRYGLTSTGG